MLVAIETDPTRYHGESARRPHVLDRSAAEQLLAHLSTDLSPLIPGIKDCALTLPGALYDQTQLLRPAYPIYTRLEEFQMASVTGSGFEARLLSIGADRGHMPDGALQPLESIPPGLLQTLPLLISGPADLVEDIASEMEHRFLDAGQLSAHSARALEAQFGIAVTHARFMTITDLNAMLHLQLEHFGFLPLWDLVDAAINGSAGELDAQGRGGQRFRWNGQAVRCCFETFDHWASEGAGREIHGEAEVLASSYEEWTREYRQYLTTLEAHAIPVEQYLPDAPGATLNGSFHVETSANSPGGPAAQVTEHSAGDLGTVAVTVISGDAQFNYYPLRASGLNQLHTAIRDRLGCAEAVSFPGRIEIDAATRRLVPDLAAR